MSVQNGQLLCSSTTGALLFNGSQVSSRYNKLIYGISGVSTRVYPAATRNLVAFETDIEASNVAEALAVWSDDKESRMLAANWTSVDNYASVNVWQHGPRNYECAAKLVAYGFDLPAGSTSLNSAYVYEMVNGQTADIAWLFTDSNSDTPPVSFSGILDLPLISTSTRGTKNFGSVPIPAGSVRVWVFYWFRSLSAISYSKDHSSTRIQYIDITAPGGAS